MRHVEWSWRVGLLALGLVLPMGAHAESDPLGSYNKSIGKNLSTFGPALQSASGQLGGAGRAAPGDFGSQLKAQVDEAVRKVELENKRSDEELKERDGVRFWGDKIKRIDDAETFMGVAIQSELNKRKDAAQGLRGLFAGLGASKPQGMQNIDSQVKQLEKTCSTGVDLTGLKTVGDALVEPANRMEKILNSINKEDLKEAKGQIAQSMAGLMKTLDSISQREDEFQAQIQKADVAKEAKDPEKAIAWLKKSKEGLKQTAKDRNRAFARSFGDNVQKLVELRENDSRVSELMSSVADEYSQYVQRLRQEASDGAVAIKNNCEKNAESFGRDNPLAPGSLVNAAYQWIVAFHKGDADFYANRQFLQGVGQVSGNMRCTDNSGQVDSLIANLQNGVNALRSVQDPKQGIFAMTRLMQQTSQVQQQLPSLYDAPMKDCQYAAQNVNKVRQFIQQVAGQVGQAGQAVAGAFGANRRTGSGNANRQPGNQVVSARQNAPRGNSGTNH